MQEEDNNTGTKPIDLQTDLQKSQSAFETLLMAGDADNQADGEQGDTLAADQQDSEQVDEIDELDFEEDDEPEQYEDDVDPDDEIETVVELSDDTPVTLNDGTEITLAELKSGQLRQSDYTKKTQALAQERQTLEADMEKLNAERQAYAQLLPQLQRQLSGEVTAEEQAQLEQLRETDPMQYMMAKDQITARQEKAQAVKAEMERVQKSMAEEQQKQLATYIQNENAMLFEKLPEWRDQEVAKKEGQELSEFLKSQGYTEDEIRSLYDHRGVIMARLAKIGFEAQAKIKKAPRQKVRKVAKAGTTNVRKKSPARIARENLAKTGSMNAATAVFENILNAEKPRRR